MRISVRNVEMVGRIADAVLALRSAHVKSISVYSGSESHTHDVEIKHEESESACAQSLVSIFEVLNYTSKLSHM